MNNTCSTNVSLNLNFSQTSAVSHSESSFQSNLFPFLFNIYYQNVRGLRTKTAQLLIASSDVHYDLFALTETWLTSNIKSSELFDFHLYRIFRSDRNSIATGMHLGGGVLLAIRNIFNCYELTLSSTIQNISLVDVVGAKIKTGTETLFVFCVYIPPQTPLSDFTTFFEEFGIYCMDFKNVIMMGDFNVPGFGASSPKSGSRQVNQINNFLHFSGLDQYNSIPNANGVILDVVLTNLHSTCDVVRAAPLLREDLHHPALTITLQGGNDLHVKNVLAGNVSVTYNFRKANYATLYEEISKINWSTLESCCNVDSALQCFYSNIFDLFELYVPKKRSYDCDKYPPWFNKSVIILIKEKNKAWIKFKKSQLEPDLVCFKRLRSRVKASIRSAYNTYVRKTEQELKSNPYMFWTFVKNLNKDNFFPNIMTYEDQELTSPQDIVNKFASYFASNFSDSSYGLNTPSLDSCGNNNLIYLSSITIEEVLVAIRTLSNKFTSGPDGIPSFLVRDCGSVLAEPLCIVFNLIITTGCFPEQWKLSKVIPILKKGDKSNISNYRPISVISNFSKILETIIFTRISKSVDIRLTDNQHGFVHGRSTLTNLASVTQTICRTLDKSSQMDVLYIDLEKAFDRLDHNILLKKLSLFGFCQSLVDLFASYLSNRHQYVQCRCHNSNYYHQKSGVPQGSVLGPLLFNIFINDVHTVIDVDFALYADDLKLYSRILNNYDCLHLQNNITSVLQWCSDNNMKINRSKCRIMSFSKKKTLLNFSYSVGSHVIERPEFVDDLGVTFDKSLTFNKHIDNIIAKAYKTLGFVLRTSKHFLNYETTLYLFKTLVRSKLEYASIIWNPVTQTGMSVLENVQRRFLKCLVYRLDGVYPIRGFPQGDLLNRFQLHSLESRRNILGILFLWSLINGTSVSPNLLQGIMFRAHLIRSRNLELFYPETSRTNLLANSPLSWIQRLYNKLLKDIPEIDIHFDSKYKLRKKLWEYYSLALVIPNRM